MFEPALRPIWWLPTIGFFLFLAIEISMFAGPKVFDDPGVGRHLRTAETILETGQITRTDPLSFTKPQAPWFDFEWAFEATIGELYRAGGLALVCAFCYAVFAATVLGVYRMVLHTVLSPTAVILITGLAFLTLHLHFSVRPVLFTYLFMALVVEVWRRRAQPLLLDWLLLPVVFVAWANLHAGWLAALLFLAGSLFGRFLDRFDRTLNRADGDQASLIPWIGLTLLCAFATLLNPWGWDLHRHVVLLATTYKSFALWDEYLPPNFTAPSMSAITIMVIVAIVFFARLSRRAPPWNWEILLPILFFLYEGLHAQRHVLLLVIVAATPVARDLEVLLHTPWPAVFRARFPFITECAGDVSEMLASFQARQRVAGGDAWLAFLAALVFAALFVRTPMGRDLQVGQSVTPRLIAFLKDHPDRFHRPLTTTWNAGPLLWNMRPDFRVSIDDRGDFYGDQMVFAFVDMTRGAPGWREKLDAGNYDSLILDPYLPLNKRLHSLPEWKEVYRDDHAVVYWKD
jgi:hypothetical protein